jgi:hypothetical protein
MYKDLVEIRIIEKDILKWVHPIQGLSRPCPIFTSVLTTKLNFLKI